MPKMICDPVYTLADTDKCITHYVIDECARHFLDSDPENFVYYITPHERARFSKHLWRDYPGRVKYIAGETKPNNRVYQFLWRPEWLNDILSGQGFCWDWDILVTTRGPAMSQVRWMNWTRGSQPKKIIVVDHFPIFNFKTGAKSYFETFPNLQLATLNSYMQADRVVPGAAYEIRGIMKTARRYLSASACKELRPKLTVGFPIPRGLDVQYPLKVRKAKRKNQKMVGIFTQRIGLSGRHPFDALDSFFYPFVKRGADKIEFQISTNSQMEFSDENLKKYTFIKFYRSSREQFYEKLKGSDFCISFSTTEGMPTSILEAICWGVIPILIRSEWAEDMAGKDYPFLFNNVTEAVGMIEWIVSNRKQAYSDFQKWYREFFLAYLDTAGGLFRVVDEMVEKYWADWEAVYSRPTGEEACKLQMDFVKRKALKKFNLFDLNMQMYRAKILRVSPKETGVGIRRQAQLSHIIPVRMPVYYRQLNRLLYAARKQGLDWKRGLEVGEIVTV